MRDGKFTSHSSRTYVEAAQRRPNSEMPRVSDTQWQALDPLAELLAELAEELCFEMYFAPGEIQFVSNHVIYHARSAFEDNHEGHDRLLLRLWLSMPNRRALPAGHDVLWRAIEPDALRGGIGQCGFRCSSLAFGPALPLAPPASARRQSVPKSRRCRLPGRCGRFASGWIERGGCATGPCATLRSIASFEPMTS